MLQTYFNPPNELKLVRTLPLHNYIRYTLSSQSYDKKMQNWVQPWINESGLVKVNYFRVYRYKPVNNDNYLGF
jgi:hypothetical protein